MSPMRQQRLEGQLGMGSQGGVKPYGVKKIEQSKRGS